MYEDDEFRPLPATAARRDVDDAKAEIMREILEAKSVLQADLGKHSEVTRNTIRYYSGSFLDVFIPAFFAVLAGGYVVKYWL